MAFQGINFANIAPMAGVDIGDFFGDILRTSTAKHENTIKGAEARHAPDVEMFKKMIKEAEAKNAEAKQKADIENTLAQAMHHRKSAEFAGGQIPEAVRIANSLAEPGTPEHQEYIKQIEGLFGGTTGDMTEAKKEGVVTNALAPMGPDKEARGIYAKQNIALEKQANGMIRTTDTSERLLEIIDKNPNLSKTLSSIMADPNKRDTIVKSLLSQRMPEKTRAEVEKFVKLTGDLILGMQESAPAGVRATDNLRDLWSSTKTDITNTDEANKYILNKLLKDNIGGRPLLNTTKYAGKKNYRVQYDAEEFRDAGLMDKYMKKGLDKLSEAELMELRALKEKYK